MFPTPAGPNLALKGMLSTLYGSSTPVNFASWMGFAVPIMLVNLALTWGWLQLYFMGPPWRPSRQDMPPLLCIKNTWFYGLIA